LPLSLPERTTLPLALKVPLLWKLAVALKVSLAPAL
jgi:hypothetical protein